jgi:nucleoside-diphosphate-sugar epimerase
MSYLQGALAGRRVLVTGATGFIGGRVAERLALEETAVVTGIGRNLDKATYLAGQGVHLEQADIQDMARMAQLMAGQDVIIHAAAWMGDGPPEQAYDLNVTATGDLVKLAGEVCVDRFVLVSSMVIYGDPPRTGQIDESYSLDTSQPDPYSYTKALGEEAARAAAQTANLALAIVRPTMVYGPRSHIWTLRMLDRIRSGIPMVLGDGSGHAHPVYIDNLVDGLLLTAVHPQAVGEAFNLSDPPIPWRRFFRYYADMAGCKLRHTPLWLGRLVAKTADLLRLNLPLNGRRVQYYLNQVTYPVHKAEQRLGYRQRVTIDQGMAQTEAWLRQEGFL